MMTAVRSSAGRTGPCMPPRKRGGTAPGSAPKEYAEDVEAQVVWREGAMQSLKGSELPTSSTRVGRRVDHDCRGFRNASPRSWPESARTQHSLQIILGPGLSYL